MEELKNVIVEQKDIFNLIKYLDGYFKSKQEMLDATESAVKQEEAAQAEWSKTRFDSNYTNVPAEFNYQLFHNKREFAALTIDISYIDGSSSTGKTVADFIHSLNLKPFEYITSLTINMNIAYKRNYQANDYSYDPNNRISQDVYIKFAEDYIYHTISGENCDQDITELKTYINDMFASLSPKLTPIITKRSKIKFVSTLFYAFILSGIITSLAIYYLQDTISQFNIGDFKYLTVAIYLFLSLVINMLIPPFKLHQLYSFILPKKTSRYDSYKKTMVKVDNVQDFISTPEVQIGAHSNRSNIRKQIKSIYKTRKNLASATFAIGLIAVVAMTILFI